MVFMWTSIAASLVAGLATGVGGGVVFAMNRAPPAGVIAFTLSFAAGVMLAVSADMVSPIIDKAQHLSDLFYPALAATAGAMGIHLLCALLPEEVEVGLPVLAPAQDESGSGKYRKKNSWVGCVAGYGSGGVEGSAGTAHKSRAWRLAVVLGLSLTLHNAPEGFAVATSIAASTKLGLAVCLAIAAHNIPEGIALAVPVLAATRNRSAALLMTILSGLSEPLGALVAVVFFQDGVEAWVLDLLLAGVAGVMVYISTAELLPEALRHGRRLAVRRAAFGVAIGFGLMWLSIWGLGLAGA